MAIFRGKHPALADEPPADEPPDGLSMAIADVFWIGAPPKAKLGRTGRKAATVAPGTVLTGELTGTGTLKPGDFVVHEQGRFEILALEAFRQLLGRVEPPRAIGLRLGPNVDRSLFGQGQQLRFER
jgi:hypothetical protein